MRRGDPGRSQGRGRGRGKLLLFGEHAAVQSYPALGISLEQGLSIELKALEGSDSWLLDDHGEREKALATRVLLSIAASLPELPRGGSISVQGDLPLSRGFGSSAALCVASVEAALIACDRRPDVARRELVWEIAHRAEEVFHGTPSGIDTGLSALGGLLLFRPRPPALPAFERPRGWPLHLVVGSLPRGGDSDRADGAEALIRRVREAGAVEGSPESRALRRLGEASEAAAGLLDSPHPDPAGLGRLALAANRDLDGLGLVAAGVASLIEAGMRAGALGGKMSGAGGGGAFFLIFQDGGEAERGRALLDREAAARGWRGVLTLATLHWSPDGQADSGRPS
jgi:mevalonate kinase